MKTGNTFPMIFFDEIVGPLDKFGIESFMKILENVRNSVPVIFLITHDISHREIADHIIEVKKVNGFSTYKYS